MVGACYKERRIGSSTMQINVKKMKRREKPKSRWMYANKNDIKMTGCMRG